MTRKQSLKSPFQRPKLSPAALRSFRDILGVRTDSPVANAFLEHLGHRWKVDRTDTGGAVYQRGTRTEAEVLAGVRLAQAFVYLASRTYENRPIVTGVVAAEQWALRASADPIAPKWLARFPRPIELAPKSAATESLAHLVDGESSALIVDTLGRAHGIIDISDTTLGVQLVLFGGYAFATDSNRIAAFYCCRGGVECHFDGFEWRVGSGREALDDLHGWLADSSSRRITDRERRFDYKFADAIIEIINSLAEHRISSIIAFCSRPDLTRVRTTGLIESLRPDLDDISWERLEAPCTMLYPILRLDGCHFLTPRGHLLSVCQRVVVKPDHSSATPGTGAGAAAFLSAALGDQAFVIKVSADGPIKVFKGGTTVQGQPSVNLLTARQLVNEIKSRELAQPNTALQRTRHRAPRR